jgi:glyoxylase-like metal-dependent hydrolase (beta-lactamase superfamily II)
VPLPSSDSSFVIEHFSVGEMDNNLYLLVDPLANEFVVIDPSMESDVALNRALELQSSGLRLTAIWNTHGHFDHILDNARWKKSFQAPLWMHEGDLFFVERLREQALWFGFQAPDEVPPDAYFQNGQSLKVGNQTVQVLHTPGHSPGSVSFYLEEHGVCISGDVIFKGSAGRTDLPGCSEPQLGESLHRLLCLPESTRLLPGHGPATTVAHEKRTNPIYLSLQPVTPDIQ